jgi:hypothetical protein
MPLYCEFTALTVLASNRLPFRPLDFDPDTPVRECRQQRLCGGGAIKEGGDTFALNFFDSPHRRVSTTLISGPSGDRP